MAAPRNEEAIEALENLASEVEAMTLREEQRIAAERRAGLAAPQTSLAAWRRDREDEAIGRRVLGRMFDEEKEAIDAAGVGDIATLRRLLARDFNPNTYHIQRDGVTALRLICMKSDGDNWPTPGHIACVADLLAEGAFPWTVAPQYGCTPLHNLGYSKSPQAAQVAQMLIEAGADVNAIALGGLTPLHYACSKPAHRDTVALLLRGGAAVNASSVHGTPLEVLLRASSTPERSLPLLLRGGAELPAQLPEGIESRPELHAYVQRIIQTRDGFSGYARRHLEWLAAMLSAKLELPTEIARIIASFYAHVGFYDAPILDEDDFDEEAARMMSQEELLARADALRAREQWSIDAGRRAAESTQRVRALIKQRRVQQLQRRQKRQRLRYALNRSRAWVIHRDELAAEGHSLTDVPVRSMLRYNVFNGTNGAEPTPEQLSMLLGVGVRALLEPRDY